MDIYEQRARVFKALCDPSRQKILEVLQNGEICGCQLLEKIGIPQSSLSYHMKILCESGLVPGRENGKWMIYRISREGSVAAVRLLMEITSIPPESIR